jgi:hypothetical protein
LRSQGFLVYWGRMRCEVCGKILGEVYGEDGFPLCRFHHDSYAFLLRFLLGDKPATDWIWHWVVRTGPENAEEGDGVH